VQPITVDPPESLEPERRARHLEAHPPPTMLRRRSLTTRSYTEFFAGAGVDRTKLALALPPLPDTADELKVVAKDLGAPASDIHLGRDASEATVKRLRLADYRVVYFATHGLVAGDIKGLAEPSLLSMAYLPRAKWRSSSSMRTGSFSPPAIRLPAISLAPKPYQDSLARFSMPVPARSSSAPLQTSRFDELADNVNVLIRTRWVNTTPLHLAWHFLKQSVST
jgi:hypothetical protein